MLGKRARFGQALGCQLQAPSQDTPYPSMCYLPWLANAVAHPLLLARGTMRSLSAPLAPRDIPPRSSGLSPELPAFMEPSMSACKGRLYV